MDKPKTLNLHPETHALIVRVANEIGLREERNVCFCEVVDIAVRALEKSMEPGEAETVLRAT